MAVGNGIVTRAARGSLTSSAMEVVQIVGDEAGHETRIAQQSVPGPFAHEQGERTEIIIQYPRLRGRDEMGRAQPAANLQRRTSPTGPCWRCNGNKRVSSFDGGARRAGQFRRSPCRAGHCENAFAHLLHAQAVAQIVAQYTTSNRGKSTLPRKSVRLPKTARICAAEWEQETVVDVAAEDELAGGMALVKRDHLRRPGGQMRIVRGRHDEGGYYKRGLAAKGAKNAKGRGTGNRDGVPFRTLHLLPFCVFCAFCG